MDRAEEKQKNSETKADNQKQPSASGKRAKKKEAPDITKLSGARPTKIPRAAKTVEEIVPPPKVNWKLFAIFAAAVFLLVAAAYANTLYGELVFNDLFNFHYMIQAVNGENYWLQHWVDAISRPLSQGWVTATYGWDYKSFKWNPGWSHLVNIVLHFTACLYLYLLIFRVCWRLKNEERLKVDPYIVAFAATALFAVHPLATGSIAYISGRTGPLLAANYFLALNCFVFGYVSDRLAIVVLSYALCFIFTGIGLLCNAQAMTLPISIFSLGILLKSPALGWKDWLKDRGPELSIFLLLAAAMPFLYLLGIPRVVDNGTGLHALAPVSYWASQLKELPAYYLRCFLVPVGLSVDPPNVVAQSFVDPLVVLGAVVVIASLAAIWIWRKIPLAVFGLQLFLIGLIPASLVVQPELVADQRFYLSLAGLCLVAGYGAGILYARDAKRAIVAFSAVVVALTGLTVWRNHQWSTELRLWKQDVRANDGSARAHVMYAQALAAHGNQQAAVAQSKRALELDPTIAAAYQVLARNDMAQKDYPSAIANLQRATDLARRDGLSPEDIAPFQKDLAKAYRATGKLEKAKPLAEEALKSLPDDSMLQLIIGEAFLEEKQYYPAFMHLQLGFERDWSNPDFLLPMAKAGLNSNIGKMVQAAYGCAKRLSQVRPSREGNLVLAQAAIEIGRASEALKALDPILKANVRDADALYLMSFAQEESGNAAEAKKFRDAALLVDPDIKNKLKVTIGKRPEPVPLNYQTTKGDGKSGSQGKEQSKESGAQPTQTSKPPAPPARDTGKQP